MLNKIFAPVFYIVLMLVIVVGLSICGATTPAPSPGVFICDQNGVNCRYYNKLRMTDYGMSIIDDIDAATARTTLGLGAASMASIASTFEAITGTSSSKVVTPAGLTARLGTPGSIGAATPGVATFTYITPTNISGTVASINRGTFSYITPTNISGTVASLSRGTFTYITPTNISCTNGNFTSVSSGVTNYLSKTITNPSSGDDFYLIKFYRAATIQKISAINIAGTSVAFDIQECDAAGSNCATVLDSSSCTSSTTDVDCTLSANVSVDANDWLKIDSGTITGAVTSWAFTIAYTE